MCASLALLAVLAGCLQTLEDICEHRRLMIASVIKHKSEPLC